MSIIRLIFHAVVVAFDYLLAWVNYMFRPDTYESFSDLIDSEAAFLAPYYVESVDEQVKRNVYGMQTREPIKLNLREQDLRNVASRAKANGVYIYPRSYLRRVLELRIWEELAKLKNDELVRLLKELS